MGARKAPEGDMRDPETTLPESRLEETNGYLHFKDEEKNLRKLKDMLEVTWQPHLEPYLIIECTISVGGLSLPKELAIRGQESIFSLMTQRPANGGLFLLASIWPLILSDKLRFLGIRSQRLVFLSNIGWSAWTSSLGPKGDAFVDHFKDVLKPVLAP